MFDQVKKFVEKASLKKPGGNSDGLKSEDVSPRLVFHYGIPPGSVLLAHDSIQRTLAISTKDGRIKLYGRDNTQAVLESAGMVSSKFLQFIENKGYLLNVTAKNHIEVWDIDKRLLVHVHVFKGDITSFLVMPCTFYMYVGDSAGNVSVLMFDEESCHILQMKYWIPLSASHGNTIEAIGEAAVVYILPQPTAESKRVLIIYRDGFITLWDIPESRAIFTSGGTAMLSLSVETKKVTSACWACSFGSKVVVGYNNGEILFWGVPHTSQLKNERAMDKELPTSQNAPLFKLNLGYKLDKVPIARLMCVYADGRPSRLYVLGSSESSSANLLQVILMNEHIESRTSKLGIHPPEPCIDMEIVSSSIEQSKHKPDCFLLLGKSGRLYLYDDLSIEKYLLQYQSRSPPSLPKEVMVRLPFVDSSITVAIFITDNPCLLSSANEDFVSVVKNSLPLFAFETKHKDGTSSSHFSSFSNCKNLYITGHSNGAINFWDISCPLLIPLVSIAQQSEVDFSLSGVPLTALYFDRDSRLLISGDQSGMIRIFKLKPEPYAVDNSFISLQGSSKKGSNHVIHSVKLLKINGAVLSLCTSHSSKHLAVGTDQGDVSLIEIEGPTLMYRKHIASELSPSVISLRFGTCNLRGFEKNVLVVATKDSSVLALESETGNILSPEMVHPKKPSKALFLEILDGLDTSNRGSATSRGPELNSSNSFDDGILKDLVLLCSEKAAYIYSLTHVLQGIKKVYYKKKFHSSSCYWASTFYTSSETGLILVFSSGKIEIRSLPDLSLLKETSLRGLAFSTSRSNSVPDSSICASRSGDIIMVNGNQEFFSVSVLYGREIFRHLESVNQIYKKNLIFSQDHQSEHIINREKKKGIFSSVIKDMKGAKPKPEPEIEVEGARESIEELSAVFSVANFPMETESGDKVTMDEDEVELDIDDVDIEDPGEVHQKTDVAEKSKGNFMIAAIKKQNLTKKFQAFKGKLNEMKVKNEKLPTKEQQPEEKAGSVDQIKQKYGFSAPGEASAAKMAHSKLNENLRKLKGIGLKTTEMQDNAQSFSSMAQEVLRSAENDRRGS